MFFRKENEKMELPKKIIIPDTPSSSSKTFSNLKSPFGMSPNPMKLSVQILASLAWEEFEIFRSQNKIRYGVAIGKFCFVFLLFTSPTITELMSPGMNFWNSLRAETPNFSPRTDNMTIFSVQSTCTSSTSISISENASSDIEAVSLCSAADVSIKIACFCFGSDSKLEVDHQFSKNII